MDAVEVRPDLIQTLEHDAGAESRGVSDGESLV